MAEKIAIVTIDAGSNMLGLDISYPERVGTSSGKGTLAEAVRSVGGLAYDSGRAYRSITYAAIQEGIRHDSSDFLRTLSLWEKAGRFGNDVHGLSIDGVEIPEQVLHAREVSEAVADYSPIREVRDLTKKMKLSWISDYAREINPPLIAFDGRAMREFIEGDVIREIDGAELILSISMVVEVTEAARRRMAQRKIFTYGDPLWALHPDLDLTVTELTTRAKKDEGREIDPVRLPAPRYTFRSTKKSSKLEVSTLDRASLDDSIIKKKGALFDTTGVGIPELQRVGLGHIIRTLRIMGSYNLQADRIEEKMTELELC